jgi:hypothetical protein
VQQQLAGLAGALSDSALTAYAAGCTAAGKQVQTRLQMVRRLDGKAWATVTSHQDSACNALPACIAAAVHPTAWWAHAWAAGVIGTAGNAQAARTACQVSSSVWQNGRRLAERL